MSNTVLGNAFKDVADAIRAKGVSGTMSPLEMPAKIATIQTSRRKFGISIDDLIGDVDQQGELQYPTTAFSVQSNDMLGIADYGLYTKFYNSGITSLSLPNVQTVGVLSMYSVCLQAPNLLSVDLAGLIACGDASQGAAAMNMAQAFLECTNLQTLNLSSLQSVGGELGMQWMCQGCTSLTTVNLSSLTSITGGYGMANAFEGCTSLTNVDLSNLTTLNANSALAYAFRGCASLTSVDLSGLGAITATQGSMLANAFRDCTSLVEVDLSNITQIGRASLLFSSMCQGCTALKRVYLSKLSSVNTQRTNVFQNAFNGCTALELVDFSQATAVPALTNTNAFSNTNETFKIVVPDALYNDWIVATNWSTYASHIIRVSDYNAS